MTKIKSKPFRFKPFSDKQLRILTWWHRESPVCEKDGIICDGAIRSGKTLVMSLSFCLWAMVSFDAQNFAMCGKTIGSFRRNVLFWLKIMLRGRGYRIEDKRSDNLFIARKGEKENYFYIFGGKDESSQDLIQGITLAGVFFDEVALMPESFVNQATGRCSVDGSKFWFNCNPDGPHHWFKTNWIDKRHEKNLLRLKFTLDDNLSLSERIKARYRGMYTGVFYSRYILGKWVLAEGVIFDMFDPDKHTFGNTEEDRSRRYLEYYISVDYGTQNPMVYGLWGTVADSDVSYKLKEYYYDGRGKGIQKTDAEYYEDLVKFAGDIPIRAIVIDPSAASFIACIRRENKFIVRKADNSVADGIRNTATAIALGLLLVHKDCEYTLKEFGSYSWDPKATDKGEEAPLKVHDHCMDETRYYIQTIARRRSPGVYNVDMGGNNADQFRLSRKRQ